MWRTARGRYTTQIVYTFENRCREDSSLALGDDAVKLVLNTKGTAGEISDELKALLRYMDGMEPDSDYTKDLNNAVTEVKADEERRRELSVARDFVVFCVDIARQSGTIMSDVGQFGGASFAVRAVASRARRPTGRFTPADRKPDAGKAGIIKKKE